MIAVSVLQGLSSSCSRLVFLTCGRKGLYLCSPSVPPSLPRAAVVRHVLYIPYTSLSCLLLTSVVCHVFLTFLSLPLSSSTPLLPLLYSFLLHRSLMGCGLVSFFLPCPTYVNHSALCWLIASFFITFLCVMVECVCVPHVLSFKEEGEEEDKTRPSVNVCVCVACLCVRVR